MKLTKVNVYFGKNDGQLQALFEGVNATRVSVETDLTRDLVQVFSNAQGTHFSSKYFPSKAIFISNIHHR